jgi:hypothetical protein
MIFFQLYFQGIFILKPPEIVKFTNLNNYFYIIRMSYKLIIQHIKKTLLKIKQPKKKPRILFFTHSKTVRTRRWEADRGDPFRLSNPVH